MKMSHKMTHSEMSLSEASERQLEVRRVADMLGVPERMNLKASSTGVNSNDPNNLYCFLTRIFINDDEI